MDTRPSSLRTVGLLLAVALGLGTFLLAVMASAVGLSLAMVGRRRLEPALTLPIFSMLAVGAGLGLPLTWQAIGALRGKLSRRFALPPAWASVLCLVYVLAVAGGTTVLNLRRPSTLLLPVIHVVALSLPPFLFLWGTTALVKDRQFTWRRMWGGLCGGAFGAAGLAFAVELVLLAIGFSAVMIVIGASPGGAERLRHLRPAPGGSLDPALMRSLFRSPAFIFALLVSLGLVVPLIEEPAKSLVPALASMWQTLTPAHGFLLGVASGAGFATLEGLFNGAASVEAWGSVALLRIGSSAMHCLASGLTGWGWGHVRTPRGWLWLMLTYGVALVLHGVWNVISIGIGVAAETLPTGALQTALATSAIGSLVLLTLGSIIALMWLARRWSAQEI